MPNLKPWIEAQLKRGYSKSQIKKALIKKGHPLNAVAEVDKVKDFALSDKKNSKKVSYKPVVVAVIVIVLLVWMFNAQPFSSKQTSEDAVVTGQESGEEAGEEPEVSVGEEKPKELEEPKITEKNEEGFNSDSCISLIPKNIFGTIINEYYTNYHIYGSQGENVKWVASEQPSANFLPFEGPNGFFVYDDKTFEGCGYLEELKNTEKNNEFKNEVKSQLSICEGKEIYSKQKNEGLYDVLNLYYFTSEEVIHATIFAVSPFNEESIILSNLGCEI